LMGKLHIEILKSCTIHVTCFIKECHFWIAIMNCHFIYIKLGLVL
jgi:hypothetical protein